MKFSQTKNENLKLAEKHFGSTYKNAYVKDEGLVEWVYDEDEKYPWAGWRVKDLDFSSYSKIRIDLESTDTDIDIRLMQDGCHIGFDSKYSKASIISR